MAAGLLTLAPLAAASVPASHAADFGSPTFASQQFGGEALSVDFNSNTTQAQLLENDSLLKIFGGLNVDAASDGGSGSSFNYGFTWTGNWDVAPAMNDPFTLSYDGTFSYRTGGSSGNASWFFYVDLDNDGNIDFSDNASMSGVDPVLIFSGNHNLLAPVSGASSYKIGLDVSVGPQFNNFATSGVTIDLPENSIDLKAVPEPGVSLLLVMAAALLALMRVRWRRHRSA